MLATSPLFFQSCGTFHYGSRENEFSVTNKGIRITTQLRTILANKEPHFLLYLGDDKDVKPVYLILQKWGPEQYVRDNSIKRGVWDSASSINLQLLRLESTYLIHDASLKITKDALLQKRLGSTRLELQDDLKVFEVIPEGVWDSAHSLLLDPLMPVALLIGFSSSPYGSIEVIILRKRTRNSIYVLPASSPAIPYVHANLLTLTGTELEQYWNLRPVHFDQRIDFSREYRDTFFSRYSIFENITIHIAAGFREVRDSSSGESYGHTALQLNRLNITATAPYKSSPNTTKLHFRDIFSFGSNRGTSVPRTGA